MFALREYLFVMTTGCALVAGFAAFTALLP